MKLRTSNDSASVPEKRVRGRLATELRYILRSYGWNPPPEMVDAIVDWQVRAVIVARTDSWVPGMAGSQDPVVKDVLSRFYAHRMSTAVSQLIDENSDLKRKLLEAIECIRFYARGQSDDGTRAAAALAPLVEGAPPGEDSGIISNVLVACSSEAGCRAD